MEGSVREDNLVMPQAGSTGRAALVLCLAAALVEGFDIQVLPLGAPQIVRELNLLPSQLGSIFSASSIGLLLGNLWGGRIGDRLDRRMVLGAAIATYSLATLATMFVGGYVAFMGIRGIAGLGFGVALPNLIAIGARLSSSQDRFSTNAAIFWGLPLGGVIVSAIMSVFSGIGWRTIFVVGGLIPLLIAPLYALLLPKDEEGKVESGRKDMIAILFRDGRLRATLLVWGTFFACYMAIYVVSTWLPTITVQRGFGERLGSQTLLAYNLLGMVGIIAVGRLADRFGFQKPAAAAFLICAVSLAVVSRTTSPIILLSAAALVGGSVSGACILLYAVSAAQYPEYAKGAGAGAALAVGRGSSILAPMIAGILLQTGVSSVNVMLLPVAAALIAASLVWMLGQGARRA
jgi:MFS transporter, AAHS family, 3-hydroxyphenylpropionic acid transporter